MSMFEDLNNRRRGVANNIARSFSGDIEKAKEANVGEIRQRKDGRSQKQPDGTWKEIKGNKVVFDFPSKYPDAIKNLSSKSDPQEWIDAFVAYGKDRAKQMHSFLDKEREWYFKDPDRAKDVDGFYYYLADKEIYGGKADLSDEELLKRLKYPYDKEAEREKNRDKNKKK